VTTEPRRAWLFDEYRDFGWSGDDAAAEYERRAGVAAADERALLQRLELSSEHTLIDVGCGAGMLAIEAAKLCRRVTAVDVSVPMLKYATAQADAAHATNIDFVHGGFLTYEHQGEPADVVVTQRALHHLPDFWKAIALQRIAAMLKTGGVFYLNDIVYSFAPEDAKAALDAWIDAVSRDDGIGFPRSSFEEHVREEYSTYAWVIEAMLRDAGFEIRDAVYRETKTYARYTCVKR